MVRISKDAKSGTINIQMIRGDTLRGKIVLRKPDRSLYIPADEDVIRFAMKRNYADAEEIISTNVDIDTLEFEIQPSQTKSLAYGRYVYDIEITFENGDVDTFIRGTLELLEEVK